VKRLESQCFILYYYPKITLSPVEYYNKLPSVHDYDLALLLDPMLATGGTAVAAIDILKEWGVKKIKLITICASTKGITVVNKAHPDVSIHVGVIDEQLSANGYILPGFGDAGDRLFNTGVNSSL
jgi:uracil phosphoribosyltransferase